MCDTINYCEKIRSEDNKPFISSERDDSRSLTRWGPPSGSSLTQCEAAPAIVGYRLPLSCHALVIASHRTPPVSALNTSVCFVFSDFPSLADPVQNSAFSSIDSLFSDAPVYTWHEHLRCPGVHCHVEASISSSSIPVRALLCHPLVFLRLDTGVLWCPGVTR